MLSVIASSAVDCEFEPQSDQNKDYQIGICCFFFMHTTLRIKSKDRIGSKSGYCVIFELHRSKNKLVFNEMMSSGLY
jgi:hypothetical protein